MHSSPPSPFLQRSLHSKCQSGVVALDRVESSIGVVLEIVVDLVVCSVVRFADDDGGSTVVSVASDSFSVECESSELDGSVVSDVDGGSYEHLSN